MSDALYVRVYQSVVDDPKFVGIFDDDHHLATWLRLLMAADAIWPLSCPLPASARRASVRALVEAGIIDVEGPRYRVHGLDAERQRRSSQGRAAASKRWSSTNAPALLEQSVSNARASSSVSVVTPEEDPARTDDFDALDVYHELTGFRPWGQWSGEHLTACIRDYGNPVTEAALRAEYAADGSRDSLLKRTEARLAKEADRRRSDAKSRPAAVRPVVDNDELQRIRRELTEVTS